MAEQTGPVWYEIRVRGLLGKTLLGAFPGMRARADEKETVLCGLVADQAALYGVLAEIEALGLELLDLRRTRDETISDPAYRPGSTPLYADILPGTTTR